MLVKYEDGFLGALARVEHVENVSAKYRKTARLPKVLGPGEVWKGYGPVPDEHDFHELDKAALIEKGRLYFKIKCAHMDRLVSGKVRWEGFNLLG